MHALRSVQAAVLRVRAAHCNEARRRQQVLVSLTSLTQPCSAEAILLLAAGEGPVTGSCTLTLQSRPSSSSAEDVLLCHGS